MWRPLCLIGLVASLSATEIQAEVLRVLSGEEIEVHWPDRPDMKGVATVRLFYINAPDIKDNPDGPGMKEGVPAAAFLASIAPPKTVVTLWWPGEGGCPPTDRHGRPIDVVKLTLKGKETTLQEEILRAGWSPLWQGHGPIADEWRERFTKAAEEGKRRKAGAWATAARWMQFTANEQGDPGELKHIANANVDKKGRPIKAVKPTGPGVAPTPGTTPPSTGVAPTPGTTPPSPAPSDKDKEKKGAAKPTR